ncbi:MAG: HD domain-containing protein, partial [Desulfobulbaceae bacterium]|nr:HD domain-containing protein [Desulfobulbaceae bacterium]
MGKELFVEQLQAGQQVEEIFLVSHLAQAETKAGKPYLILTLMDKTGEISCRVWDNAELFASQAAKGNMVLVRAMAQSFRDELQLKVDHLQEISRDDPRVDPADYLPCSDRPSGVMLAELDRFIGSVKDKGVAKLLRRIFKGKLREDFAAAPAAKKMHHAYLSGLLEHTLSVTGLADKMATHYPQVDRDILIAGALLHDLGKVREFSYDQPPFDYTDSGRLIGHMLLGSEIVRSEGEKVSLLSRERLDQVIHLILSHHGRHEYGAPILPQTVEAILLHYLDDMDSKMNYIDRLCGELEEPGMHWSAYQRPLERFLYLRKPGAE